MNVIGEDSGLSLANFEKWEILQQQISLANSLDHLDVFSIAFKLMFVFYYYSPYTWNLPHKSYIVVLDF